MKTKLLCLSVLSFSALNALADYPEVYPFIPYETKTVIENTARVTEDPNFIKNVRELDKFRAVELNQFGKRPWGSTYWPLNKGTVADPYNGFGINPLKPAKEVSWETNYSKFNNRREDYHPKIINGELSENDLEKLAPSEKYDLILGDESFDLTNRLWKYAATWGEKKKHGFVSQIHWDMAQEYYRDSSVNHENYVLKELNSLMALWEGICHGWSTAAGTVPRPEHSFEITLDGKNAGKKLKFYPDDIKGLASLFWANSLVQDEIIMEGLRCNEKNPSRDEFGRFYDSKPDAFSKKLEPRCVGVHPAIWHMSTVNLIGKQQRSFIVERKIKSAVDNHPMTGYEIEYFHPDTGKDGSLLNSIVERRHYKDDPFQSARNPEAVKIVGVKFTMKYIDWARPKREERNTPKDDDIVEKKMMYDLELDKNDNIVGGQWRVTEKGKLFLGRLNVFAENNQPDFFWVVPKDFASKPYMQEMKVENKWENLRSVPPKDWKNLAQNGAHSFMYTTFPNYPFNVCKVEPVKGGDIKEVPCTFLTNRPQPMLNVLNKLLELSRK
jgi:hypothetical protein